MASSIELDLATLGDVTPLRTISICVILPKVAKTSINSICSMSLVPQMFFVIKFANWSVGQAWVRLIFGPLCSVPFCSSLIFSIQGENGQD
jgi:hypothetical protein